MDIVENLREAMLGAYVAFEGIVCNAARDEGAVGLAEPSTEASSKVTLRDVHELPAETTVVTTASPTTVVTAPACRRPGERRPGDGKGHRERDSACCDFLTGTRDLRMILKCYKVRWTL